MDRTDGVFVSRIALESAVYSSGCIVVGDEILAVNLVDVTRMSLDDVVIIMSIPRRLVLTTRRKKAAPRGSLAPTAGQWGATPGRWTTSPRHPWWCSKATLTCPRTRGSSRSVVRCSLRRPEVPASMEVIEDMTVIGPLALRAAETRRPCVTRGH